MAQSRIVSNGARPAHSRYAHVERERRWLLPDVPPDLPVGRTLRIRDRYLVGTGLRLRVVEEAGQDPLRKLGQKVPLRADDPSTVAHTTMYLDLPSWHLLATLPGAELSKTRHLLTGQPPVWAVDVFDGPLRGLVLAEIDLGDARDAEAEPLEPPGHGATEVTTDARFTGGALVQCRRTQLEELLSEVRGA